MNLSEWILKSRDERIAHCDLTTPCCFSEKVGRGHQARGAIFEFHEITNDVGNLKTARIGTNHLCDKDSNNGECCNPLHLYRLVPYRHKTHQKENSSEHGIDP